MKWHAAQDAIAQGTYGAVAHGKWRGCSVACGLRSLARANDKMMGRSVYSDHEKLAKALGIPLVLVRINDSTFESLPPSAAMAWPVKFSLAIRSGADLSLAIPRWLHAVLADPEIGVIHLAKTDATKIAVNRVAALYARQLAGEVVNVSEWREARSAAADAAYAAAAYADADAAYAAAYAATYAHDAAYAATAATYAASAATYAAYAAAAYATAYAYDAAKKDHLVALSEKLLAIMGACR
jgi:hypothetical protein